MLKRIYLKLKSNFKNAAIGGLVVAVFFVLFFGALKGASAQSIADPNSELQQGVQIIEQPLGLPATDIRIVVARIIRAAFGLVGIVMVVLILYAGYLWMTAGGNEEQISKAKGFLKNAVIGLAIMLSAFAIVTFVMRILGYNGNGTPIGENNIPPPYTYNLRGSGALSRVVRDHYPTRNQTDVARNTRIIITFTKPILLDGLVGANNKLTINDNFINIKRLVASSSVSIGSATVSAVSTTVNGVSGIYTIVIRPDELLGSDKENISYSVHIGNSIRFNDMANSNPYIFANYPGSRYYEWTFTCGVNFDFAPPHVVSVMPKNNSANSPRNTIIQVKFSEAIDPTGLLGNLVDKSGYFGNLGESFYLKTDGTTLPLGSLNLVDGYQTLEFTPSQQCDTNACGNPIFCLPCKQSGDNCAENTLYQIVLRSPSTTEKFVAVVGAPGIRDTAGNSLDGNEDDTNDGSVFNISTIFSLTNPDHYGWSFNLKGRIDKTTPYLELISPSLNQQFVSAQADWKAGFTKPMRVQSLYDGISIEEKPTPAERDNDEPIGFVPRTAFDDSSLIKIYHEPFLSGRNQFYYPILTSKIEDVHFNCFYPGKGPGGGTDLGGLVGDTCSPNGADCCNASSSPANSDLCCNGVVGGKENDTSPSYNTTSSCVGKLKDLSIIPGQQ